MNKSFCKGCEHWHLAHMFDGSWFHYCHKLGEFKLKKRKELCNGKYWKGE